MWLVSLALVVLLVLLVRAYSKHCHNYWASRGVPTFPDPVPIIGHINKMMSKKVPRWIYVDEMYKKNIGSTFCGYYEFLKPQLIVGDPDLVKAMAIKDFDHFVGRRFVKLSYEKNDVSDHFLINADGTNWKGLRSALSPIFTSGRMKGMFPLVKQKADALIDYINKHKEEEEDSSLLLKKTFTLYTTEVIASVAFGMESGAFENENAIFSQMVAEFYKTSFKRRLKLILILVSKSLCRVLGIGILQKAMSFFSGVVKESMAQRDAGLYRGDFLDLMMEARRDSQNKDLKSQNTSSKLPKHPLEENDIIGNSVLFIIAGFSTSASTLTSFAFLLAKHPNIQEELREEIKDFIDVHGGINYQGIMESKLLEACLSETLRLYPPSHFIERQCSKEYRIPGTDVIIPRGMMVNYSVYSIQHDEKYWPEPEEFKPERFMPENKENIKSGTYLGFGIGPRNCIGMRFAQMQIKLAITNILLNFELNIVPGHETMKHAKRPGGTLGPTDELRVAFCPLAAKVK